MATFMKIIFIDIAIDFTHRTRAAESSYSLVITIVEEVIRIAPGRTDIIDSFKVELEPLIIACSYDASYLISKIYYFDLAMHPKEPGCSRRFEILIGRVCYHLKTYRHREFMGEWKKKLLAAQKDGPVGNRGGISIYDYKLGEVAVFMSETINLLDSFDKYLNDIWVATAEEGLKLILEYAQEAAKKL